MKEEFVVNKAYLLQKFPGKGGWTFALIPEIKPSKNNPFGWQIVKGWIDNYTLKTVKLMPYGNGQLFLPVKAQIRRTIKKEAGDYVWLKLTLDNSTVQLTDEILACFKNETPEVNRNFLKLSEERKKYYMDRIYDAKTDETKARRIIKMMNELDPNHHQFNSNLK